MIEQIGTVESLAFGGQGIIRQEGLVIFVPFTAPGDTVKYSIKSRKKSFAQGELISVLSPSSQRVNPSCRHYSRCGGCQLQHLNYSAQLEIKRQWVIDALTRIGGFLEVNVSPVILETAEEQWTYRRRITLTLRPKGSSYQIGFHEVDFTKLIPIQECLIFSPKEHPIFNEVSNLVEKLVPQDQSEAKVSFIKEADAQYSLHFHFKVLPLNAEISCKNLLEQCGHFSNISVQSPQKSLHLGKSELTKFSCEGLDFCFAPTAFVQNHPEQSRKIYQEICRIATEKKRKYVVDLYCGIGISTLLIGQFTPITGVELNKEAVKMAKYNQKQNQLDNNVSFIHGNVDVVTDKIMQQLQPDLVIVNPPRNGLSQEVISSMTKHKPNEIVYVSCMPSTLARDLKALSFCGYKITSCQPYDMFPQTSHIETLVTLKIT